MLIGPGLSTNEQTGKFLFDFINECSKPLVIDADGLTLLAANPEILKDLDVTFNSHHPLPDLYKFDGI